MNIVKGTANDWQVRFRLWAALVMAAYVVTHTINFSLGIISIDAMDAFQRIIMRFWRSTPVYWLVIVSICVHVSLGLWKLFKRNTLKMPAWEMFQIGMGICIPFFLLPHVTYTRGMHLLYGTNDTYIYELLRTFPGGAWQYVLMTVIVWGHAHIGIHMLLRMRTWYPRIRVLIIGLFLIFPVVGISGYISGGIEAASASRDSEWLRAQKSTIGWPTDEQLNKMQNASLLYYAMIPLLYTLVLGSRSLRLNLQKGRKTILVRYSDGKNVLVYPRTTILEASRIGNIPHASICGGRGRCSTCRVRVDQGLDGLKPPGEREKHVLKLIDAEPNVRLACQMECTGSISVTRLLPPDITATIARRSGKYTTGKEITLVVMFADLRGFTSISEGKLPYDVVFMLNRYFSYMGEAIEESGGYIDKFLGDGIMAIFGLDTDVRTACIQSIRAAKKMAGRIDEINSQLVNELREPLKLGIGLHVGNVILGEIGYKLAAKLTVIGDTVNTASRLEVLNKKTSSQLIFSRELAEKGGFDLTGLEERKIIVRGKEKPLDVFIVKEIKSMPDL